MDQCPPFESILEAGTVRDEVLDLSKFSTENETAKLRAGYWILDVGSSVRFTSIPKNRVSPCLTRSRCNSHGYYMCPVWLDECPCRKSLGSGVFRLAFANIWCKSFWQRNQQTRGSLGPDAKVKWQRRLLTQHVLEKAIAASGLWPSQVPRTDFWTSPTACRDVDQAFNVEVAK